MQNTKLKINSLMLIFFISILSCNIKKNQKNIGIIRNLKRVLPTILLLLKEGKNEIIDNTIQKLNRASCLADNQNCTSWLNCCSESCLNGKCYGSQYAACNITENCFNLPPNYNYECKKYSPLYNLCYIVNYTGKIPPPNCRETCSFSTDCSYSTCLNYCCCSSEKAPCGSNTDCCLHELGLYKCINGKCNRTNTTTY